MKQPISARVLELELVLKKVHEELKDIRGRLTIDKDRLDEQNDRLGRQEEKVQTLETQMQNLDVHEAPAEQPAAGDASDGPSGTTPEEQLMLALGIDLNKRFWGELVLPRKEMGRLIKTLKTIRLELDAARPDRIVLLHDDTNDNFYDVQNRPHHISVIIQDYIKNWVVLDSGPECTTYAVLEKTPATDVADDEDVTEDAAVPEQVPVEAPVTRLLTRPELLKAIGVKVNPHFWNMVQSMPNGEFTRLLGVFKTIVRLLDEDARLFNRMALFLMQEYPDYNFERDRERSIGLKEIIMKGVVNWRWIEGDNHYVILQESV